MLVTPDIQDPANAGELNGDSGTNPAECNEAGNSDKVKSQEPRTRNQDHQLRLRKIRAGV
jgi:hypothetical protein